MNLKEFLKDERFKNYSTGIAVIEEDFIKSGYEKFLFRRSLDDFKCREQTEQLIAQNHDRIKPIFEIEKFIDQFSQIELCALDNSICIIYPDSYDPIFYIIEDVIKRAGAYKCIINNVFDEDETVNYLAVIDGSKRKEIALLHHLVYPAGFGQNFGGYKMFGLDLSDYIEFCADGDFVYSLEYQGHEDIRPFQGVMTRKDTNPFRIYNARKKIEMLLERGYFKNDFEIFSNLVLFLMPFLQEMYSKSKSIADKSRYDWKLEKAKIKSRLVEDGVISSKWKNEESLFKLVKKQYPDSIYQYRPAWLSPQSLDIYIPSLKIGIEYQGVQHYQSVDFFGGEDSFIKRKALDENKRRKCIEKNVKLIEWNYLMDVSVANLKKQLMRVMG